LTRRDGLLTRLASPLPGPQPNSWPQRLQALPGRVPPLLPTPGLPSELVHAPPSRLPSPPLLRRPCQPPGPARPLPPLWHPSQLVPLRAL
jgi:hypothetical protein